jgi:hypothetical protein
VLPHGRPGAFSGFCVAKNDLRRRRWEEGGAADAESLAPGQLLVEVTRFGLTANNITYARLGEEISYWRFFPALEGWGYIPVWGIGAVVGSRHPEIRQGERVYGYFPMATHLVMHPDAVRGVRFVDGTAHRCDLPPVYNEYVLIDRDRTYDHAHRDAHLVLRPLFSLSFFCAEFLKEERFFGARQILISSASSKSALGLAFLLARARLSNVEIVGLTSPANADFVAQRGVYDRVVSYETVRSLADKPAVLVDIAGNAPLVGSVHRHLRGSLRHSARVGFTHWDAFGEADPSLPGPAPKLFFTPDHILKVRKQWGVDALATRLSEAWQGFLGFVNPWLAIEHSAGKAGVERAYREVLEGSSPPEKANVLSIAGP